MKINSHGIQPSLPVTKATSGSPAQSEASSELRTGNPGEVGKFSLPGLISNLKNDMGVRAEAVDLARAKVQSGAYLSRSSATSTAEGILGS